jgi:hypothetical protein
VGKIKRTYVVSGKSEERDVLPSTLFSCHVDTVHSEGVGKQSIVYDPSFGHIFLDKSDPNCGSCLGADDGAGIWLMLEMISAKVPGVYVFHRGEERGGIGSRAMLSQHKAWLQEFDLAVAFDRPDNYEVITHQGGARCASDKFAKALCAAFKERGLEYKPSDRGVFTDTKVYRGVISECTNLGVGYYHQHGKDEYLDYAHLVAMRDALVTINWSLLPADREPKEDDWGGKRWGGYGTGGYSGYQGGAYGTAAAPTTSARKEGSGNRTSPFQGTLPWPDEDLDERVTRPAANKATVKEPTAAEEMIGMTLEELREVCEQDPEAAVMLLISLLEENAALEGRNKILRQLLSGA